MERNIPKGCIFYRSELPNLVSLDVTANMNIKSKHRIGENSKKGYNHSLAEGIGPKAFAGHCPNL